MKKVTMQTVEYVGMEDVQELIALASKVHKKGSYACIEFCNYGHQVSVCANVGPFRVCGGFDYSYYFNLTENQRDVNEMNAAKDMLRGLGEED